MCVVYRHIRLDTNEPFYVGIGVNAYRATQKAHRNQHWTRIVEKTDYKVDILFDDLTREEAIAKEIEFIALYGRRDLGLGTLVNFTDGGEGHLGHKPSKENLAKRAKSMKGKLAGDKNPSKRPEVAKKISEAAIRRFKNNPHPRASKVINTETGEIYKSIAEAERKNNLNIGYLSPRLRGALKNNTKLELYVK